MTKVLDVIGKELTMEVARHVELVLEVLSEKEVKYTFIDHYEETEDDYVVTELYYGHDDIDDIEDYYFMTELGSKFFLFQFEERYVREDVIHWLEENRKNGFFEGQLEETLDFNDLTNEALEWYFREWVQPDREAE